MRDRQPGAARARPASHHRSARRPGSLVSQRRDHRGARRPHCHSSPAQRDRLAAARHIVRERHQPAGLFHRHTSAARGGCDLWVGGVAGMGLQLDRWCRRWTARFSDPVVSRRQAARPSLARPDRDRCRGLRGAHGWIDADACSSVARDPTAERDRPGDRCPGTDLQPGLHGVSHHPSRPPPDRGGRAPEEVGKAPSVASCSGSPELRR